MKKTEHFQIRMSAETREQLERLRDHYEISASSVICMLIFKETRDVFNDVDKNTAK